MDLSGLVARELHIKRLHPHPVQYHTAAPAAPRGQRVIAHGILDSYRQDKALQEREVQQTQQQNGTPVSAPAEQPKGTWWSRTWDSLRSSSMDEEADEDDTPCPLECVQEISTVQEFQDIINKASPRTLVVIDFFRTACGACKYIQPGFVKLCKRSGSRTGHAPVKFLKHNVIDEYDERTELADHIDVRAVPSFQFWKGGELVDQFATRDKVRISLAIDKHAPGAVSL